MAELQQSTALPAVRLETPAWVLLRLEAHARGFKSPLGCDVAALLVGGTAANDSPQRAANDDRDEIYDDGPAVMFEQPGGGASKATAKEPVDMGALLERTLMQLVADSDGRFTDEDAGVGVWGVR